MGCDSCDCLDTIRRGSTPRVQFAFHVSLEDLDIETLCFTFSQEGETIFTRTKDSVTIIGDIARVILTEAETLKLRPNKFLYVQCTFVASGMTYTSTVSKAYVTDTLQEV